jgi:integrase
VARLINRLSDRRAQTVKDPGMHPDGGGLYLRVTVGNDGTVNRYWLFRYASRNPSESRNGKDRQLGLGPLNTVSLAEARGAADRYRKQLLMGVDPIDQRKAEKKEAAFQAAKATADANALTFNGWCDAYIAAHRGGWRSIKHSNQWTATLKTYAKPVIGHLPVRSILVSHIVDILRPIWIEKNETARRVRGRIEAILDYAADPDDANYVNPAEFTKQLRKKLPKLLKSKQPKHHPALPYCEAASFLAALRLQEGTAARALEFLILTAARTGEVLGAAWSEIDFETKIWTVRADRMKGGRDHKVPLSNSAVAVLERVHSVRQNQYIFPGDRERRPLSNMAMDMLLRRMGYNEITVHGFRSTFRTWAAEKTNFQREVAEAALAHAKGDKLEAIYERGDFFDKRRRMMDAWAKFCARPAGDAKILRPHFGGHS